MSDTLKLTGKHQADWAERMARKLWRGSVGADLAEEGWLERIAAALRRAEKRGYARALREMPTRTLGGTQWERNDLLRYTGPRKLLKLKRKS